MRIAKTGIAVLTTAALMLAGQAATAADLCATVAQNDLLKTIDGASSPHVQMAQPAKDWDGTIPAYAASHFSEIDHPALYRPGEDVIAFEEFGGTLACQDLFFYTGLTEQPVELLPVNTGRSCGANTGSAAMIDGTPALIKRDWLNDDNLQIGITPIENHAWGSLCYIRVRYPHAPDGLKGKLAMAYRLRHITVTVQSHEGVFPIRK